MANRKRRAKKTIKLYFHAILVWIALTVFAVLNGAIRQALFEPWFGRIAANAVSSFILIIFVFLAARVLFWKIKIIYEEHDLLRVGIIWAILTVAFEFLFFRYVMGVPFLEIAQSFNFLRGEFMLFVVLFIIIAPFVDWHVRKRHSWIAKLFEKFTRI